MYEYDGEALADRRNAIQQNNLGQDEQPEIDPNTMLQYAVQPTNKPVPSKRKATNIKGKFIVDAAAFLNYGSGNFALGQIDPYYVEDKSSNDIQDCSKAAKKKTADYSDAEKEFLLVLPPRFLGYSTQEKFWGQFKVDATKDVRVAKESLFEEKLQLDHDYKQMIQALVHSHTSSRNPKIDQSQVRDVVEDKGKGLVILLHGPPGVGKTVSPNPDMLYSCNDCLC
jgi:flagellar biosynthesis GTPase FlhF